MGPNEDRKIRQTEKGENEEPPAKAMDNEDETAGTEAVLDSAGELDTMREKWMRAMADRDNLRKRATEQTKTSVRNERKAVLNAFLNVLDSLQHALAAHEGEQNDWVEGTQNIYRQTLKIFKDYGAEPIEAKGRPFDPNLHEAVSQVPAADQPEGTVVEVLQTGFCFQDGTLLRPSRVVVSCKE